ncbi:MAG: FliI/YscN family ATPase, partial [Cellulomonas sp.]|nr:FliI/YscN family ATPase [Cellulomonas sp.]
VGPDLAGRVLDALGRPIDGGPALTGELVSLDSPLPHPLERQRIRTPMPLGVRALDTATPCGRGQRVGIFAGSGVGKSTLLGMMARGTKADVVVVGLVGERGREVREFLEDDLGEHGRERVVTVVATSDEPPLARLRAAYTATRVAEHFRDQGLDVLLLVDSLTRFAMARREIGLAAGEPPATRGYPPSVFAELPRLLERAGPAATGTITGLYTVLVEGDDMNDPVADHARSILDGHVVLSRKLASAGHFPTIDVLESVSRLAGKVTSAPRLELAGRLRRLMAAAAQARELVEIGAYVPGSDPVIDEALLRRGAIEDFLRQPVQETADSDESWARLAMVLGADPALVVA